MTNKQNVKYIVVLLPSVLLLFIQYIWKMFYLGGRIPGIYWLFVFLDKFYIQSIVLTTLIGVTFLLIGLIYKHVLKKDNLLFVISLTMLLTSMAIICSFPIYFAQTSTHMEALKIDKNVYYLSAYPMFDINFSIAKCGTFGILCRTIYRSGDITNLAWRSSHLVLNTNASELQLRVPDEGVIFTYPLKP